MRQFVVYICIFIAGISFGGYAKEQMSKLSNEEKEYLDNKYEEFKSKFKR